MCMACALHVYTQVPLDYRGAPFPEYAPKLGALLGAIDRGRRPSARDAWEVAPAEAWVARLEPGTQV